MGTIVSAKLYAADEKTAAGLANRFEEKVAALRDSLYRARRRAFERRQQERGRLAHGRLPHPPSLVAQAKVVARDSDRAFEPTIGPLVNVWKIGFGGHSRPSDADIKRRCARSTTRRLPSMKRPGPAASASTRARASTSGPSPRAGCGTALASDMKEAGAQAASLISAATYLLSARRPRASTGASGVQRPDAERNTVMAVVEASGVSVITSATMSASSSRAAAPTDTS